MSRHHNNSGRVQENLADVMTSGDTHSKMQYQEIMSRQDKRCRDIMTTSERLQKTRADVATKEAMSRHPERSSETGKGSAQCQDIKNDKFTAVVTSG